MFFIVFTLKACCSTGADDSNSCSANCETDQNQTIFHRVSNHNLARFIFRVFFILENTSEWVSKDCYRFFEFNPVIGTIGLGLFRVPLKLETYSV